MSDTPQEIRQLLLDLSTEYQQLEKPANPELLKLHIEAYEDKFTQLIASKEAVARDYCYSDCGICDDFRKEANLVKEEDK